jgi:transposase
MCGLLVGLPDVTVVGVGEWPMWLRIVIATDSERPSCCGRPAHRHGVREVVLVDLPVFGRPARLVWRKQRWRCAICRRSWTGQDPRIASARCGLTTRAGRWATLQAGVTGHRQSRSQSPHRLACQRGITGRLNEDRREGAGIRPSCWVRASPGPPCCRPRVGS